MKQQRPNLVPRNAAIAAVEFTRVSHQGSVPEGIDTLQLSRLASTVLTKSPEDLAALAQTNPLLVKEWITAFRQQHAAAKKQSRYWASASAALATARGPTMPIAAE